MALDAGTRFGPYTVTGQLGAGGMGEVYRAADTDLKRDVAIKVLPESFAEDADRLARFRREAEILASLNHPNIAQIYGLEKADGRTVIVMELVEGPTLADRIAEGPIPPDEVLGIARQIVAALEAAHERQIVHRDLKPANIKVRADGLVKVLDFGISKPIDAKAISGGRSPVATTPAVTETGVILGTAAYMSPEQARGKLVDQRTDIWAFGCLLFEMLTGQPAFGGEDVMMTLARVLDRDTDLSSIPGAISPAVRQTIKLCLEKDAAKRIADIRDVRLALDGQFESLPSSSSAAGLPPARPLWRRILPVAAAALIAGVIVGFVSWAARPEAGPGTVDRFADTIAVNQPQAYSRWGTFALSQDGRRIVYQSGEGEGIYVRTMDTLGARLIPGSENIFHSLIFSPDGRSIAFVSRRGKLVRLELNGGAPSVIVESDSVVGISEGTWDDSNEIIYTDDYGVYRVSADGGVPELLMEARAGEFLDSPELLPDGETLLVSAKEIESSWDEAEIVAYSLATGERTVLIQGGSDAHYLPSGHLIYARGDALYGVAFDSDALTVSGPGQELVRGVTRAQATSAANYGVGDDGTLAYLSRIGAQLCTLVWADRDGNEEPIDVRPQQYVYAQLSDDDSQVALNLWDERGRQVSVLDLERHTLLPLTFNARENATAIWAPNGRIAFTRTLGNSDTRAVVGEVFWQAADGSGVPEQLTVNSSTYFVPSDFSPDGRVLFMHNVDPPRGIWTIAVDDSGVAARPLIASGANELNATLSPDGNWLAYESDESGQSEVYVRAYPDVDSGGRWTVSDGGGTLPVWSRDPEALELFYVDRNRSESHNMTLMAESIDVESGNRLRPEAPRALFESDAFTEEGLFRSPYDVSLDGQRFLMIKGVAATDSLASTSEIVIVRNWFEELKRLVPTE